MHCNFFFLVGFLFLAHTALCQEFQAGPEPSKVVVVGGDTIVYHPEKVPAFPGGPPAIDAYFAKHLTGYSKTKTRKHRKTMWVSFVIQGSGKIGLTNLISNDKPEVADKLVIALKSMPPWEPAVHKGRIVATIGEFYILF